ncbi:MAG: cyclopropane-fatty-acyl-phospholipid synthase, partial [Deltaproteobacteria bacterium]|nr:cyclopropane-fatty-acyl-phospholipid synthase [Deltaproteobacteria bacterium]
MKGGGYYDAHSKEQRAAMAPFLPWLEEAVSHLPLSSGHQ